MNVFNFGPRSFGVSLSGNGSICNFNDVERTTQMVGRQCARSARIGRKARGLHFRREIRYDVRFPKQLPSH